jgi:hypothetical protein
MAESFLARLTSIEQHHPRTPALKIALWSARIDKRHDDTNTTV